jgi:hypothetical protein
LAEWKSQLRSEPCREPSQKSEIFRTTRLVEQSWPEIAAHKNQIKNPYATSNTKSALTNRALAMQTERASEKGAKILFWFSKAFFGAYPAEANFQGYFDGGISATKTALNKMLVVIYL